MKDMGEPLPKKLRKLPSATGNMEAEGAETMRTLKLIDGCQTAIEALSSQGNKEFLEIEKKYSKLRKPHTEKRQEYLNKIPHFWLTAFLNHPDLRMIMDDTEEDYMQYLQKISVEEFDDITFGYRIDFHFDDNPYFENAVLSKEYSVQSAVTASSQSTPIKWKGGCDLTTRTAHTSKRVKGRYREHRSFFGWFCDNVDSMSDDIGEIIKDDLWLNPLPYYLVPDIEEDETGPEDDDTSDDEENAETEAVELQGPEQEPRPANQ